MFSPCHVLNIPNILNIFNKKNNCLKSCLGDTFVMMMKRPQSAFRQQVCCGNGCHASPAFTANDCDCPVLFQISALQTGFPLSFIVFLQTISKFSIFFLLPVNSSFGQNYEFLFLSDRAKKFIWAIKSPMGVHVQFALIHYQ